MNLSHVNSDAIKQITVKYPYTKHTEIWVDGELVLDGYYSDEHIDTVIDTVTIVASMNKLPVQVSYETSDLQKFRESRIAIMSDQRRGHIFMAENQLDPSLCKVCSDVSHIRTKPFDYWLELYSHLDLRDVVTVMVHNNIPQIKLI
jgi:hypothetical protein